MIRLLLYQFHKTSGASLHNVSQSVAQSMELVRNAHSQVPPRSSWSETLKVGPRNLCFNKPSRWLWWILEFENYCSRKAGVETERKWFRKQSIYIGFFQFQNAFKMWLNKLFITDKKFASKLIILQYSTSRIN